jgi:hypothetical protein
MRDQNTDPTFSVLKSIVDERPGFSFLVKTASVGEDVRGSLPQSSFADPYNRLFPIHTPEHALLSKAYFSKQAGVDPEIGGRIDNALSIYDISMPPPVRQKVAAAEVTYLLPATKQFPLPSLDSIDADTIKQAELAIIKNARKLSPTSLATAATTLVKVAADKGLSVETETLAYAGLAQCDLEKAAEWVEARGHACPKAEKIFCKLAEGIRTLSYNTERSELIKVANAIAKLDEEFGLARLYGKKLPNPQETVFNTKTAMQETMTLAGRSVPMSTLMARDVNFYGDVLGPDIVTEISEGGDIDEQKLSEVLPTLPLDMQKALVNQLGV